MLELLPISSEPSLRLSAAIERDPGFLEELARQEQLLLSDHYGFNGQAFFVKAFSAETVEVYPSCYAEKLTFARLGGEGYGTLCVALILFDEQGRSGWQLRGEHVHYPGYHHFSVGGGVERLDLKGSLLTEAEEEIGLQESDLIDLRPVALASFPESLVLFYSATLRDGTVLTFNEKEVADFVWTSDPLDGLHLLPSTRQHWPALEQAIQLGR